MLSKSEFIKLDCDGLRNANEAIYNEKLELLHRQLGYNSLLDLLKTIPDIPWRNPLFDKAGTCPSEQTPNGSNTDEMIARQRLRTNKSEQHKVEDDGKH